MSAGLPVSVKSVHAWGCLHRANENYDLAIQLRRHVVEGFVLSRLSSAVIGLLCALGMCLAPLRADEPPENPDRIWTLVDTTYGTTATALSLEGSVGASPSRQFTSMTEPGGQRKLTKVATQRVYSHYVSDDVDGSGNHYTKTVESVGELDSSSETFSKSFLMADDVFSVTYFGETYSIILSAAPETWIKVSDQSVTIPTQTGGGSVEPNTPTPVNLNVTKRAWDILQSNYGRDDVGPDTYTPWSGASVMWSASWTDASTLNLPTTLDSSGNASFTVTPPAGTHHLVATVSLSGCAPVTVTIDFSVEVWAPAAPESSLGVTLTRTGNPKGLFNGQQCDVTATVVLETWRMMVSNFNNKKKVSMLSSSVATGAAIDFNLYSGDGEILSEDAMTDSFGEAKATIAVGDENAYLHAVATFDGASLDSYLCVSQLAEEWEYSRDESVIAATLSAANSTDLAPDQSTTVTAHVNVVTWEVWLSNKGKTDRRNQNIKSAINAQVNFSKIVGDEATPLTSRNTDNNGDASVPFTMGTSAVTVRADAAFSGADSTYTTVNFTVSPWRFVSHENFLTVYPSASSGDTSASIAATVTRTTGDRWINIDSGETQLLNGMVTPATGVNVNWGVVSGNAYLNGVDTVTDAQGIARASVNLGTEASTFSVSAYAMEVTGGYATADVAASTVTGGGGSGDGGGSGNEDIWVSDYNDGSLTATLSFSASAFNAGSLAANVTAHTWQVGHYQNSGLIETRYDWTGPASGADLVWTSPGQLYGATITSSDGTTGGNGGASGRVIRGAEDDTVTLTVSYGGMTAQATALVTAATEDPGTWDVYQTDTFIDASLTSAAGAATANLTASVNFLAKTWERNSKTGETRPGPDSSGPANGALVTWSVDTGDAALGQSDPTSDVAGRAGATATLGTTGSTIVASISFAGITKEVWVNLSECTQDSDGDGLTTAQELAFASDPNINDAVLDSDGDGISDAQELLEGTDPHDANSNSRSLIGLRVLSPLTSL